MNGSQTLPRDLIKWLDSLDLAYAVRNVRRDLANGFIIAEILSRYYPKEVNIYTYGNGLNKLKRYDNWEQIKLLLQKKDFILTKADYEPIVHQAADSAFDFLAKMYEFLTKKKLPLDKKPKPVDDEEEKPSYLKPTALSLARDRELTRIVDEKEKLTKTQNIIQAHYQTIKQEKQDSNIIEYLVMKRKQQLEEQLRLEEEAIRERKKKYNVQESLQPEVKEIQLRSYNSSTSKKSKEQQGNLMEAKGILDFLQDQNSSVFKKDPIQRDLRDLKIDDKMPQLLPEIFNRCDEVSKKSMKTLLNLFIENNIPLIIDTLNNNFLDFKKFFSMLIKALDFLKFTSKTYLLILTLFKKVGSSLIVLDPTSTQMMFETIILQDILKIINRYQNKKYQLCEIIFDFCGQDSYSRLQMIKTIKEIYGRDARNLVSLLSTLITFDFSNDIFTQELYEAFASSAYRVLKDSSPICRTQALKILNEITLYNYEPILKKLHIFEHFIGESWWEALAQTLIICSHLLLILGQEARQVQSTVIKNAIKKPTEYAEPLQNEQSFHSEGNLSDQFQKSNYKKEKQSVSSKIKVYQDLLIEIVLKVFVKSQSQNILRIGLIYIAPVLNYYDQLCDPYLEILLGIDDKIRETVLMTNPLPGLEEGQIVHGCFSFNYKLTSAPLNWNSIGIAKSMEKFAIRNNLQNFKKEHLEILLGCLFNQLEEKNHEIWIQVYENLKGLIFVSMCYSDLCALGSDILKKIFLFEAIQSHVLNNSQQLFLKLLRFIYKSDADEICREILLDFFEFLKEENKVFQAYIYEIIKEFSEKDKNLFLKSNLINFMNNLAKERREKLHGNILVL